MVYREVDTFDRYSIRVSKFGEKLGLTAYQGYAVLHVLELRNDPQCYKEKRATKGYVQFRGLSNKALEQAKAALQNGLDINQAVADYNTRNHRDFGASPTLR